MAGIIFLLLVATPIVEIFLFIKAGEAFGLWPTIGAVIVTALLGTVLLRQQGFSVLRSVQASVDAGRAPVTEAFHGFCIVIGGALLLTPGFLTDAVGFALLTPPVRAVLARWLGAYAARRVQVNMGSTTSWEGQGNDGFGPNQGGRPGSRPQGAPPGDRVIDGEFEPVIDPEDKEPGPDDTKQPNSQSPWNPKKK
jgi:UPF0716 protein FxsA